MQWQIQDFLEGTPTLERGTNLLFGQFFPKTAEEMKKFWAGRACPSRPLDLPLTGVCSGAGEGGVSPPWTMSHLTHTPFYPQPGR